MLRSRLIPVLLIHKGLLHKTVRFSDHKYVGDPLNAVRIFNEKQVDELIVLDIDASVKGVEPNYDLVSKLAVECRMPLCYGGGIKKVGDVERLIGLGVEKVAIGSALSVDPGLVVESAKRVGSQSLVGVVDVKKVGLLKRYSVVTHNASRSLNIEPLDYCKKLVDVGVGELLINSVDHDGTMKGFDSNLIKEISQACSIPLTAVGGCGSLDDAERLSMESGPLGLGAGSIFVFKGKYKAVLISYPEGDLKRRIVEAPACHV